MLYYAFNIIMSSPIDTGDPEKLVKEGFGHRINRDVLYLNEKQDYNVRFYVCGVRDAELDMVGIIGYKNTKDPNELAMQFAKDLGFDPTGITSKEITSSELKANLRKASRNDFIFDSDEIEIGLNIPSESRRGKTRTTEIIADSLL